MLGLIIITGAHLIQKFLYFKYDDIAKSYTLVNIRAQTQVLSKFKVKPDFGVKLRFEARCLHISLQTRIVLIENVS